MGRTDVEKNGDPPSAVGNPAAAGSNSVLVPAANTGGPVSETAAILSMIERAARDPAVDIDKLERLFQMRERVTTREAEVAFNTAMATAQAELKPVVRNTKNDQTGKKYADLDALARAVDPIIHKHGFGLSYGEFQPIKPNHVGIVVDVMHACGHSRQYKYEVPADGVGIKGNTNKTPTWAYGSSLSYGRRYAKLCVFDVATFDDDGQAAGSTPATASNVETLRALIKETSASTEWICQHYSVETLDDLNGKQIAEAIAGLHARKRQVKK